MKIFGKFIFLAALAASVFAAKFSAAQEDFFGTPKFGAQVYIEPGQTPEYTENLFRQLKENGMKMCRIRLFERYMRTPDGGWDFSLFDRAMRLAQKYDIKVAATFFPYTEYGDISGWKFPKSQKQLDDFAAYLEKAVNHFKKYDCIFTWVLMNEPGGGFRGKFVEEKRARWNAENPPKKYLSDGYLAQADLREWKFRNAATSEMLEWVAAQVRKYDPKRPLHVNNHSLFKMAHEYDFPRWRKFLTTLGGSAHPSWHFGDFDRSEFDVAMLAYSEIINSGAGTIPWFMTELQGGNNTFSGERAMCPTKEETTQWLWEIVATNGRGAIFWTLNAKMSSFESGEWGLLDYLGEPSDRLEAAAKVARCIDANADIFQTARKHDTKASILYVKESLQAEKAMAVYRKEKGMIWPEMLGFFKAWAHSGVGATLASFDEYDFGKADYSGETVVLANQIALPRGSSGKLENFVSKGGTLIITGLTGYYDEDLRCAMMGGFEYEKLFGGLIREFKHIDASVEISVPDGNLSGNRWKGIIRPNDTAKVLCEKDGEVLALENKFGKGRVVWIPTLLAYGEKSLADWLGKTVAVDAPVSFAAYESGAQMKLMKSDKGYIAVVVNNGSPIFASSSVFSAGRSETPREIKLKVAENTGSPKIIFANKGAKIGGDRLRINSAETAVIFWEKTEK